MPRPRSVPRPRKPRTRSRKKSRRKKSATGRRTDGGRDSRRRRRANHRLPPARLPRAKKNRHRRSSASSAEATPDRTYERRRRQMHRRSNPNRRGWRITILSASTLILITSILATAAAEAQAAPSSFIYELCDPTLPGGNPPALDYAVNPGPFVQAFDNCATPGGSVGLQETGSASATYAWLYVDVPPTPGGWVENETVTAGSAALGPGNDHVLVNEPGFPTANAGDQRMDLRRAPGTARRSRGRKRQLPDLLELRRQLCAGLRGGADRLGPLHRGARGRPTSADARLGVGLAPGPGRAARPPGSRGGSKRRRRRGRVASKY